MGMAKRSGFMRKSARERETKLAELLARFVCMREHLDDAYRALDAVYEAPESTPEARMAVSAALKTAEAKCRTAECAWRTASDMHDGIC